MGFCNLLKNLCHSPVLELDKLKRDTDPPQAKIQGARSALGEVVESDP